MNIGDLVRLDSDRDFRSPFHDQRAIPAQSLGMIVHKVSGYQFRWCIHWINLNMTSTIGEMMLEAIDENR